MNLQSKHSHSRRTGGSRATGARRARRQRRGGELDRLVGRVRELSAPSSLEFDGRPHGHVIGHAPGEPLAAARHGVARGHVVARPDAQVQTLDGFPRGHVVAARDAHVQPLNDVPHGHVVARGRTKGPLQIADPSTASADTGDGTIMGVDDHGFAVGVMGGADQFHTPDVMGDGDHGVRLDVLGPTEPSSRSVSEVFGESESGSLDSLFGA
jgi:hypothetical protein